MSYVRCCTTPPALFSTGQHGRQGTNSALSPITWKDTVHTVHIHKTLFLWTSLCIYMYLHENFHCRACVCMRSVLLNARHVHINNRYICVCRPFYVPKCTKHKWEVYQHNIYIICMFFCYSIPFSLPFSRLPPPRALPSATRDGAKVLRSTTGIPVLFPKATWFRGLSWHHDTPRFTRNQTKVIWKKKHQDFHQNTPWVFPKIVVPQNGWFIMKNPIKIHDLGVPLFLETPTCCLIKDDLSLLFLEVANLTHQSEVQSPRRLCESWQAHLATWLPRSPNSSLGWMEFQPLPPKLAASS